MAEPRAVRCRRPVVVTYGDLHEALVEAAGLLERAREAAEIVEEAAYARPFLSLATAWLTTQVRRPQEVAGDEED